MKSFSKLLSLTILIFTFMVTFGQIELQAQARAHYSIGTRTVVGSEYHVELLCTTQAGYQMSYGNVTIYIRYNNSALSAILPSALCGAGDPLVTLTNSVGYVADNEVSANITNFGGGITPTGTYRIGTIKFNIVDGSLLDNITFNDAPLEIFDAVVDQLTYGTGELNYNFTDPTPQVIVPPAAITTGAVSGSPFCAGATIPAINFTVNPAQDAGVTFYAHLSNADGTFPVSPTIIGSLTTVGSTTNGTILNSVLPGTAVGTGYRIRVYKAGATTTDNGTNLTINAPSITTGSAAGTYCQGQSLDVTFNATCIGSGNTYSAQLSDASGSFASPTVIGTLSTSALTGSIPCVIPSVAAGAGYKIRIVGTHPSAVIGTEVSGIEVTTTSLVTGAIGASYQAGSAIPVPYVANCYTDLANSFVAQLSDNTGSFASPTILGQVTGTASGTISGIIPVSSTTGAGYFVRVVSTSPVITANTVGPITILPAPEQTTFTTLALSASSFCPGAAFNVPYTVPAGSMNAGNVFTAQLSDASGDFSAPTNIGTLATTASSSVPAVIPFGTAVGIGYKVRVTSSDPVATSTASPTNISVVSGPNPYIANADPICYPHAALSTYQVTTPAGATNDWNVTGGTIENTTSNSIDVNWGTPGPCNVRVTQNYSSCSASFTRRLFIFAMPENTQSVIDGPATVQAGSSRIYSVPENLNLRTVWEVVGGTITTNHGHTIEIYWETPGVGSVTVKRMSCPKCVIQSTMNVNKN